MNFLSTISPFHHSRLFLAIALLALLSSQAQPAWSTENRPNIILFLADDLGAGDLASAGHPYAKTPNLDRLAKQSLTIFNAYSAGTWCSPSRYALMRGQYPGRGFYRDLTLNPEEPSITLFLKPHGYTTAHIGKWHLKGNALEDYAIDFPYAISAPNAAVQGPAARDKAFRATSTELFVDKAIAFIEDSGEQPFYLNLWANPTHSYIEPHAALVRDTRRHRRSKRPLQASELLRRAGCPFGTVRPGQRSRRKQRPPKDQSRALQAHAQIAREMAGPDGRSPVISSILD